MSLSLPESFQDMNKISLSDADKTNYKAGSDLSKRLEAEMATFHDRRGASALKER